MKIYFRKAVLLFVLLFISRIYSQTASIKFSSITVEQGLSQNSVYSIFQDKQGFIWFGTQDGLNKYDGYKFKIYRHEPGNINSLSDYAVNTIVEDNSNVLWIATRDGLNSLDLKTDSFKVYKHNPQDKNSISNNFIEALCVDDKYLWIGTRDGLNRMELESKKIIEYRRDPANPYSISANFISSIYRSKNGVLWIATLGGLNKYNDRSEDFIVYKSDPENPNTLSSNSLMCLAEDPKGQLWIGTIKGLNKLTHDGKFVRYLNSNEINSLSNNYIRSIFVDKSSNVWIGTYGGGLEKFNPALSKFTHYRYDEKETGSISSDFIKSVVIDNSGTFWIGTLDKGISKFSFSSQKFPLVKNNEYVSESLGRGDVTSFLKDKDGYFWIGTDEGGLNKIPYSSLMQGNISFTRNKYNNKNSGGLNNSAVTALAEDKNGNLWIGTFGGGINILDKNSNTFKYLVHNPGNNQSLSNNFIHAIFQDKAGTIWIGTGMGGLVKYDPGKDSFRAYKPDAINQNSISSPEVTSIAEDSMGFLWIGTTTGGLNKFDKDKEIFYCYRPDPQNINSLSSLRINTLYIDKKGNLWIGTFGGGLNKFNLKENSFEHYTSKDGLPSNTIFAIVEDEKRNLWLSTAKGISKFNQKEKIFKNYNNSYGLQGDEFVENACYKDTESGYIYFGGIYGFNFFHPDSLKEDNFIPPVVITDFKIFNKSVPVGYYLDGNQSPLSKCISFMDEITLSHSDNVLSFEFASLHFANPEANRYAYKMQGFDKDWTYSGNLNSAFYTNLDPGTYIFKVRGTNSDGIWNNTGAEMKIIINPPWWQTWWAYLIYGFVFISALFTLRKYEINRIKLKNNFEKKEFEARKLLEVDQIKSRFFANISHEFRTPLTLILGILDKYLKNDDNKRSDFMIMKKNALRSLQLINQLLELSKFEAGTVKLTVQKTEIIKFVRRIVASFVSTAEQRKIGFKFNDLPLKSDKNGKDIFLYIDQEKIETVVYNLLSNAIKFTPEGGEISVKVLPATNSAEISIINKGVTIPENELPNIFNRFYQGSTSFNENYKGTGIGLALVKELIEIHRGKINVKSKENVTEFNISLPLGRTHVSADQIVEEPDIEKNNKLEIVDDYDKKVFEQRKYGRSIERRESGIVLVVEDHFDLRNYICEQLENDYSIIESENGEKGLNLAEEFIPDLVISDIMMPKLDGYQLCRELKTNFKTNHIPVILLTAKAEIQDKLEGLETGADDYIIKPFNPDELKTRVKNLISIRQKMREKFLSEMILKPAEVIVPSNQKVFIEKLTNIINQYIEDENFSVEILSKEIGMSRSQLHRKLKALSNQSPSEFIRNFRLQRAADLIKRDAGNMAQISYMVGFSSQAYFTKLFQEMYGQTPLEFKKKFNMAGN